MPVRKPPLRPPLVVYLRERSCELNASDGALNDQRAVQDRLKRDGYHVAGIYCDDEVQPPDYGWLEDRPGLSAALEHAARNNRSGTRCQLAVLRVDGIGAGDRFPIDTYAAAARDRDVHVWGLGDTATGDLVAHEYAHAMETPLPGAAAKRSRTLRPKVVHPEHIIHPGDAPAPIAAFVLPMPGEREARVYLCNGTAKLITGRYEELTRGPDGSAPTARHYYRPSIDGTQRFDIEVAPGTCQWLFSFARGTWRGETDRYRLTLETGGRSLVAKLVVEGHRFEQKWREITWL